MNISKYHDKGYTGLINIGNTCFLNSCIQVLSHTYELNELITSKNIERFIKHDKQDTILLNEWISLRNTMWENNGTVSPNRFVNNIQRIAKLKNKDIFTGWNQNDMPEFLMFIIDSFHNSISRSVNIKISGQAENNVDNLAIACYTMLKNTYAKEYSEIMEMFYGISVSVLVSMNNRIRHSIKPETYFILDLPIPQKNKVTIYDCFDYYTQPEELMGENAWYNEKTGCKEDVKKELSFWSFPKILVITLKRFSYDGTKKINDIVDFPLEDLDLSKYVSGYNASQYKYDLYGICNHIGNMYTGHYTSFVKNSKNEWIHFNDDNIELINNTALLISPISYCLFYRKKNNIV
jgi:ubiquitin carboxyl-terminal hydrolase 8